MIQLSSAGKRFGHKLLFEGVDWMITPRDRIGLVGPNGAGKSTLFGLILHEEEPDAGAIALQRGMKLGYLPQESAPASDETVVEMALHIDERLSTLYRHLNRHDGNDDEGHLWKAEFEELNGYELESKAKKILKGLSFRDKDFDRPCREGSDRSMRCRRVVSRQA